MTVSPRILNLDELPTTASNMTIVHEGTRYEMVTLTVEAFIDQEKRAAQHQALIEQAMAGGENTEEEAQAIERKAVEVLRDAVLEFFPTLPVGQMPVAKLFAVFGWLNDMSQAVNTSGAEGASDAEGNV